MEAQRLWPRLGQYGWGDRLKAMALVPVLRAAGDKAKMTGYPVGLWWRWQHRGYAAIHWRRQKNGRSDG